MTSISPPRVTLANLPTPIQQMERLTALLGGPELWIKRDDLTGLALGGNKVRKLEYLVAEAQSQGASTLVTAGAVQSNHCRQTAGAAARVGMDCILVLEGIEPESQTGNVLLDRIFGAELVWIGDQDLHQALQAVHDKAAEAGRMPYLVPFGGSSTLGSAGYVSAMRELLDQGVEFDRIVLAITSGGTSAGLLAGAAIYGYRGQITCIRIGRYGGSVLEKLAQHANEAAVFFGETTAIEPEDLDVREAYLEPGYAVLTDLEREAIETFAQQEGILLDPVYTGRAAGGMMDLIRQGEIGADERVLFWHTGGTPAIFAFSEELLA